MIKKLHNSGKMEINATVNCTNADSLKICQYSKSSVD